MFARVFVLFAFLGLLATALSAAELKRLVFAPLPMEDKKSMYETFLPLSKYLEETLGVQIEYRFTNSYAELLGLIAQQKVDLAYLGPLPFVMLEKEYPKTEPLIFFKEANGRSSYTCSLISWRKALGDLHVNQKVALTSPLSTCGYLGVSSILQKRGKELEDFFYRYLGKHDKVALSVVEGRYSMGGVKTTVFEKYKHLGLKEIAKTVTFPSFALVADRTRVDKQKRAVIQEALLRANDINRQEWSEALRYGFDVAQKSSYAPLKKLLDEVKLPR